MASRQVSLIRKLVPFTFDACGPVGDIFRMTFEKHPHLFPTMLSTLQNLDTASEPRVLFAEGLQMLMDEKVSQARLRQAFEKAEVAARKEHFMAYYDEKRANYDFNYRLATLQLCGCTAFWNRMFFISSAPLRDAVDQLAHLYTADGRRDPVMNGFVLNLTERWAREKLPNNAPMVKFVQDAFIIERDIFGPYRLDKFAERVFVFHALTDAFISPNDQTAGFLWEVDAVRTHGNFLIEDLDKFDGRWRSIKITCRSEDDELPPWNDTVFHPEIGRDIHLAFDQPLVGRPPTVDRRISVDGTLYPKTSSTEFELAVQKEDVSFMGKLWRRRWDKMKEDNKILPWF